MLASRCLSALYIPSFVLFVRKPGLRTQNALIHITIYVSLLLFKILDYIRFPMKNCINDVNFIRLTGMITYKVIII